jgi:hypothetical protein
MKDKWIGVSGYEIREARTDKTHLCFSEFRADGATHIAKISVEIPISFSLPSFYVVGVT